MARVFICKAIYAWYATHTARPAIFLLIALIGTPLGYFARAAYKAPPNRAVAMVRMFENHCLPLARQEPFPVSAALIHLRAISSVEQWADKSSKLMFEYGPLDCKVSDVFRQLDPGDRLQVASSLPIMLAHAMHLVRKYG